MSWSGSHSRVGDWVLMLPGDSSLTASFLLFAGPLRSGLLRVLGLVDPSALLLREKWSKKTADADMPHSLPRDV